MAGEQKQNDDTAGGYAGIETCRAALEEMKKLGLCCGRCKYFVDHESVLPGKYGIPFEYTGECRRFPPQVSPLHLQDDGLYWTWPDVDWNFWCGEWQEYDRKLHEISFLPVDGDSD